MMRLEKCYIGFTIARGRKHSMYFVGFVGDAKCSWSKYRPRAWEIGTIEHAKEIMREIKRRQLYRAEQRIEAA